MEYNTQRNKLKITDYGRNVAKLIDYCKTLDDRDERNKMAETIIDVMAHVNPKVKERTDYRHILWDHMMLIANYELDVDSPYPIEHEEDTILHPHPIKHQESNIHYRHYGRALEDMVKAVAEMEDSPERQKIVSQIAHTMKRQYLQWNRETVEDELIVEQLTELSGGRLSLPEGFKFRDTKEYTDAIAAAQAKKDTNDGKKKKKKKKR